MIPSGSAEPGQYRLARTPYARGIMDAIREPGVEEIWIVAGTQVGKSTIQENLLGYWIDNDPGPALVVKPSESACEQYVRERLRPLLQGSLPHHLLPDPHDNTLSVTRLDTMPVFMAWAGSPQSLASRACRYVLLDEVDKFPPFAGREADAVSLARERTATFLHRRRIVGVSTPTTRDGLVWQNYEACGEKRSFHLPCPRCGRFAPLTWQQVKWDKPDGMSRAKLAETIESQRLAWYECAGCGARLTDGDKIRMLDGGRWVGIGGPSRRIGFHLSSLYSPWRTFSDMAAEFIRADGDVSLTMSFRNSRLAEPFEIQLGAREPGVIRRKIGLSRPAGDIPGWAIALFATVDVQQDHLWYVLRSWGYGFRSCLHSYGRVGTFDDLHRAIFSGEVEPVIVAVDAQYRRPEVFEYCKRLPTRIVAAQGVTPINGPMVRAVIENGVTVLKLNPFLTKSRLSELIEDSDETRWLPHSGCDDQYVTQLVSERQILDAKTGIRRWEKKYSGAANHLLDCEAMQVGVACWNHLDLPETDDSQSADPVHPRPQHRGTFATSFRRY